LSEESAAGDGFLAEIAKEWEAESLKAEAWRTRVVLARFGIILAKQGGALPKMVTPFRMDWAEGWEAESSGCRGLRWKM